AVLQIIVTVPHVGGFIQHKAVAPGGRLQHPHGRGRHFFADAVPRQHCDGMPSHGRITCSFGYREFLVTSTLAERSLARRVSDVVPKTVGFLRLTPSV